MGADGVEIVQRRQGRIAKDKWVAININAIVQRSDDTNVSVRLVNMSFKGCEMTAVDPFEVGERVWIQIDRQGFIEAEICWSFDGRVGAEFLCECHV